jgi:hypothetical protein
MNLRKDQDERFGLADEEIVHRCELFDSRYFLRRTGRRVRCSGHTCIQDLEQARRVIHDELFSICLERILERRLSALTRILD